MRGFIVSGMLFVMWVNEFGSHLRVGCLVTLEKIHTRRTAACDLWPDTTGLKKYVDHG